ncbi:iron chelate uptake ABC transporter family permease subunit [uncultured Corynebacterium sp.]|uniref:FecCD family ABC transporter permease n=1 Tax=uncultured Corynebacterium sp. TaxID=159447 RepID=UPI0028899A47|nr:iron chelate uptake ABC transporter family permease subunit [uncultured Corynebacterium sp.]
MATLAPSGRHRGEHSVNGLRATRTAVGLVVGVALAVAGAVMQAITSNPLADPGLLGVNSGASLAIVVGAAFFGLTGPAEQLILAAVGACLATVAVYIVGTSSGRGASPVRLVLAGAAISAAAGGFIAGLLMSKPMAFDAFRYWDVGALTRLDMPLWVVIIPVVLGLTIVAGCAGGLTNIALGDDVAAALGTNVVRVRTLSLVALTLLCASATAIAGPIGFVGLMVPLFAAFVMGPHRGWIVLFSAFIGPCVVLSADILGRVIARPAEIAVGLLTAFVGAPVLLYMVYAMRRARK